MATMGFLSTTTQTTSSLSDNTQVLVPETFTHAIAFGQTGSGKTTGFIYPNLEKEGSGEPYTYSACMMNEP